MTLRRQTLLAAVSLACLSLPALVGCDVGPDEPGDAGDSPTLAELIDNIEPPENQDIEPTGQPCEEYGAAAICLDGASVAFCGVADFYGKLQFGACIPEQDVECVPGDVKLVEAWCGQVESTCSAVDGIPRWVDLPCEEPGGDTPLVLRFDDAPISMIDADATPDATFDIAMAADGGSCITTDWPSAATPWLAVDLDHSGSIDGGHELFGSGTRLADGNAHNGFLALAVYDENRDGVVDARDPRFGELLLWRDHDADRLSGPGELETLADAGVDSLSLDYASVRSCDARGNCAIERAGFEHADGRGELVDLHLTCH